MGSGLRFVILRFQRYADAHKEPQNRKPDPSLCSLSLRTERGSAGERFRGLLNSTLPITRSPVLMHYGGDEDAIKLNFVKNRKGKAWNNASSYVCGFDWSGLGGLLDALRRFLNCLQEV